MRLLLLIASALVASSAVAQTPGSCEVGTAQAFLDVSDVQASLFNTGSLFLGEYFVPQASGSSPLYLSKPLVGGKVNGVLRTTPSTWGGHELWPGPLNEGATLPNPDDCSVYDRIWTVSTYDVAIYEQVGIASSDLADWPVGLGAPAVDANGQPVMVTSREQTLELANGERPVISGTQTAFWVMNDVGNEHGYISSRTGERVGTEPLGIEVAVTAVSIASLDAALHQGTFYRYALTNRNTLPITEAYVGIWGSVWNGVDHFGVDTTRALAFAYEVTEENNGQGTSPAIGFDFLDGIESATVVVNGSSLDFVYTPEDIYFRLQGLNSNGDPICEGGTVGSCFQGGPVTRTMFAGDPVTGAFWSGENIDGEGTRGRLGSRRFIVSPPRFDLQPGESKTLSLAILFAQGADRLDSITELRAASDRVQAAYDDGSLFRATEVPALLTTPDLLGPDDDSTFDEERVILRWTPVPEATLYRIEQSLSPSFDPQETWTVSVDSTSTYGRLGVNEVQTLYWRVRAESPTRRGPFSEARSYTSYVYRYFPQVWTLADGSPAYVEVAGPDGTDPCAETASSRDGCDEIAGNLVYQSFNSTGEYYFSEAGGRATGSDATLGSFAPNDFEVRFSETGSLGFYTFQEGTIVPVPFEIWDIGVVAPGDENDPSDDVRMIPILFADNGGTCAFNADEIPEGQATTAGYVETDRIYAYYPTTTYADFETAFSPLVDAAEGHCYTDADFTADAMIDFGRGRPIQRQVFGSSSDAPALPQTGTVIRMYTTDPRQVADEATPRAGDLTLGPAYPNPTASSLTVPYRLASSRDVELAVYDVLGRQVVELVNARQPEGAHTAQLDASALAPGVYVVRLRAGDAARTTRITVVR